MRRPARTALTAAGVAIGVGLIVALLSIAAGVRRTAGDLIHVGRADFGVFQESRPSRRSRPRRAYRTSPGSFSA
jgi:ABC-type antimicrobial peptide transport system permease subunit